MRKETYKIWSEEEYSNPLPGKFVPHITAYLHEDETVRDTIVIVPGGGYRLVACAEGEIVAEKFFEKGYNTFVLTYTTALFTADTVLGKQPLKDLAQAVKMIRLQADRFRIRPDHLAVMGFSAGGHLCGSLAVHWDDPSICPEISDDGRICRPDAVILSYPVITAGTYAHQDSFQVLLGAEAGQEEKEYFSIETQVTEQTPPSFVWHTAADETVPVENSLLYEEGLRKAKVPCELHIFPEGPHGYSLADDTWASGTYGGDYTMDQWFAYMQVYLDKGEELPPPFQDMHLPKGTDYREFYRNSPKDYLKGTPNSAVAVWPDLADRWLKNLFSK
ncbi:MAG TPA: alpha/beta hydrolase [Candidatus Mediterraneibacter intestinavium]|nr:alpha/beta hydrolase [Candidatus Mediterraneibacter intestinavium]